MKRFAALLTVSLLTMVMASGCATNREVNKRFKENTKQTDILKEQVKQQVREYKSITHDSSFWVSAEELEIRAAEPAWLNDPVTLRVASSRPAIEMFSVVSEVIHTGISIKPDAMAVIAISGGNNTAAGGDAGTAEASSERRVAIDYNGSKRGLLDHLAGQLGIYWRIAGDQVEFYLLDTRIFHISTLGGKMDSNATVGSGGAASGGAGGGASGGADAGGGAVTAGTQDVQVKMSSEIWVDLVKMVKSLASPLGKIEASESLGLISVTDAPPALESVEKVINKLNASMNTQVMVDVHVYSLELTDKDDYQIDWNAFFTTVQGGGKLALQSAPAAQVGLSTLTATLLSTAPGWNQWQGTNAVIKALSKIGKVAIVTSGTMVTMNNQPVPINLQRSVTYLASTQSGSISTGVATGPTLTPGTVNTGFQMNVMPRVLDEKRLMLQCALNISSLQSLGTISSGTGANALTIQTPEVISRSILQRAMLRSGETLILTGFEQEQLTSNKQGMGMPENILLGGENLAEKKKTSLIVMITPHIVETKQ